MDRSKISFAEAEGKARFPAVLKWGEIDQRVRSALWTPFYKWLVAAVKYDNNALRFGVRAPLGNILFREFAERQHKFVNDYDFHFSVKDTYISNWSSFYKKADYVELFDFLTFILRDRDCPKEFVNEISTALDKPFSPYRIVGTPPTIIPLISEEQAALLKRNVAVVFSSLFGGAKVHLQSALDSLNSEDFRGVVRESIDAVESAVRDFTNDPNAVLSKAIKKLADERNVHRALCDAFGKLYAYSSDENGIRHALVFGENEQVGLDEAIFFVSACSAFVAFLSQKNFEHNNS